MSEDFTESYATDGDKTTIELTEVFLTAHPIPPAQFEKIEKVRKAAFNFAMAICHNLPECADRSAAIRKVREAVWTAHSAIILEGVRK